MAEENPKIEAVEATTLEVEDKPAASAEARSRKDRVTGSTHFGDVDFNEEQVEEIGDATWGEVCRTCFVHDAQGWARIAGHMLLVCFALYFFLFGLDLLGSGANVLTTCTTGNFLSADLNPIAGLMIGIIMTVLLQSSSTTTSIVVALVGAGSINVKNGIYLIMGANIGTSVTNTIVSMGFLGNGDDLERAFAGATVHDMFNFLTVAILLPVEAITGYLYYLTKALLPGDMADKSDKWEGPLKKIVSPLTKKVIIPNKDLGKDLAKDKDLTCAMRYPIKCANGTVDYNSCMKKVKPGLIGCDKKTGSCPAFFQDGASQKDDEISGFVCVFLGLVILITCLIMLVKILQKLLLGTSTRIIYKATNVNGYIGMVIGCGITMLVQSSSITTSVLTPLVGMGVLHLEQMFPLTLGANIGTTVTGLLAGLVGGKKDGLQVALAHLFFNITGIIIWYPYWRLREVPLNMARTLGKATRIWRFFPIVYILVAFILIPAILLGISMFFTQNSKGFDVLGIIVVILLALGLAYTFYQWRYKGLKERVIDYMEGRQRRGDAIKALPKDMGFCKAEIQRLKEHTGLPDEEEGKNLDEEKGGKDSEESDDA